MQAEKGERRDVFERYSGHAETKTWAVVGATDNQEKFGYKIFKCMKAAGYTVYPVNPGIQEVMGEQCYPTLADLPVVPDAVDLVVNRRIGV